MTPYRVTILPEAQEAIREAFLYIADRSPLNAEKWMKSLLKKIENLGVFPRKYGDAREQGIFVEELRQMVFKSHRIIYTLDDKLKTVFVVQVRHAKRRPFGEPVDDV